MVVSRCPDTGGVPGMPGMPGISWGVLGAAVRGGITAFGARAGVVAALANESALGTGFAFADDFALAEDFAFADDFALAEDFALADGLAFAVDFAFVAEGAGIRMPGIWCLVVSCCAAARLTGATTMNVPTRRRRRRARPVDVAMDCMCRIERCREGALTDVRTVSLGASCAARTPERRL
jgi:hypothetical protein